VRRGSLANRGRGSGLAIAGMRAVIIGRSEIVGRPLATLLVHRDATVTQCHSKTRDLPAVARQADILIAAVGHPAFVRGEHIRVGAVVIDVGINRLPNGKLVGDVEFESARRNAAFITPVPGGVGPMTVAMLMKNTLESALQRIRH